MFLGVIRASLKKNVSCFSNVKTLIFRRHGSPKTCQKKKKILYKIRDLEGWGTG